MCGREFKSRTAAIAHYRDAHLRWLTYCQICDQPIGAKKFGNHLLSQKHKLMAKAEESSQQVDRNAPKDTVSTWKKAVSFFFPKPKDFFFARLVRAIFFDLSIQFDALHK